MTLSLDTRPDEAPVTEPRRVQLSRAKGWRMPPNTAKVDRTTKWGNPFIVGEHHNKDGRILTARQAVDEFARMVRGAQNRSLLWTMWAGAIVDDLPKLRGKNLACWCALDEPCHADVLLELANAPEGERP